VNVNIHQSENKERLQSLDQLPDSCVASAEALEKQRKVFEQYHVFSGNMIDGIINRLKAYNDINLRSELERKPEDMKKLVADYFHCG